MNNELEELVADLKKCLATKEKDLELIENSNLTSRTSYTQSSLSNRCKEIESFELACNECSINECNKIEIIANFKKCATKIKEEIKKI